MDWVGFVEIYWVGFEVEELGAFWEVFLDFFFFFFEVFLDFASSWAFSFWFIMSSDFIVSRRETSSKAAMISASV